MYDPKFEKGMRQKMEGLEFVPSEAVWERVEKAVANRRRRRIPFFFRRFAVPGVFLAAAAGVLYYTAGPANSRGQAAIATQTNTSSLPVPGKGLTVSSLHQAIIGGKAAVSQRGPANSRPAGRNHITGSREGSRYGDAVDAADGGAIDDAAAGSHSAAGEPTTVTGSKPEIAGLSIPAAYCYQPQRAAQGSAGAVRANLLTKKATIALKTLQKPERPWEAGFMGGAGLSELNRLHTSAPVASSASSFLSLTNSRTVSSQYTTPTYTGKRYTSKVQSEVSYMAGIYLEKPLSNRWVLNLGMNLHYYSTRVTIGPQVNTYVPASVSLITPTTTSTTQSTAVYSAGDDQHYTNRFYFLELPVGVQWRVNKSRMLPLFLEGGASLSRLMGANALLYNSTSGIYYKDASVIQKTQFNVSSALMVGLPFHGIRIQMGPQVQYGLTPLINNKDLGEQHFLYTGIRIVVVPGRR